MCPLPSSLHVPYKEIWKTKNFYEESSEPVDLGLLHTSSVIARKVFGFLSRVHPWDVDNNVAHQSYPWGSCMFSFVNV